MVGGRDFVPTDVGNLHTGQFELNDAPRNQSEAGRFSALVAAIAGWFYAKSYEATGSVRSAMVTHALTNVVARVFLST